MGRERADNASQFGRITRVGHRRCKAACCADGAMALEVKGSGRVANKDLRALAAFAEEFKPKHAILICNDKVERLVGAVRVVPWKIFLDRLWAGDYLK
jgi:hypothetical protein